MTNPADDIKALRVFADDFNTHHGHNTALAEVMRRVATMAENSLTQTGSPVLPSAPAAHISFDADGVPLRVACVNCWEE